ncbi:MAG: hypothetical protein KH972_02530 [Peptostreptococcaceae bacterium]|nr:hypothetical protein [Peptostreptococcaceae bacterium]
MRVKGQNSPKKISIEKFGGEKGKVEVRIRENVVSYDDEIEGEQKTKGFEYDEYVFILDDVDGLYVTIENDFENWVKTGRELEVNPRASLYLKAKTTAIDEYTEQLALGGLL